MRIPRPTAWNAIALVAGIVLGATWASSRPLELHAGGGDRPDAAVVTTAPIATETNQARKIQITNDAVYYLNYSRGFLYAAVPMPVQVGTAMRVLSDFGERDLLQDFQIPPGITPHFTMTSGTMGGLSEGWAPLYVFETTTGQMAAYRADPQMRTGSSAPILRLLEKRAEERLGRARTTTPAASK